MPYSGKELEFLGKQVAEGQYVRRATFFLALALALLLGVCLGRYVFPDRGTIPAPQGQKQPLTQDSTLFSDKSRKQDLFQSILSHEEEARRNPDDAEAWKHLGDLYYDVGEPAKSVNAYNKALALKPGNPNVLVDCGVMYRALEEYDKALEYFQKALVIQPWHEHALFNSGVVLYYDLNRKGDGLKFWRELVKINPNAKTPDQRLVSDIINASS